MRYKDTIIKVHASNNRKALAEITNKPLAEIQPEACIDVYCKGNKIRDWDWIGKQRNGILAWLFG